MRLKEKEERDRLRQEAKIQREKKNWNVIDKGKREGREIEIEAREDEREGIGERKSKG